MTELWKDIRHGLRILANAPGFTAIAILVLAIGIGASTTMFSALDAQLFRPVPYPHLDRLVQIWETIPRIGFFQNEAAPANYFDWVEQNTVFEEMGLYRQAAFTLSGEGQAELFPGARVSPNFLRMLGAGVTLGRGFAAGDDKLKEGPVALLSHSFWQNRFGGASDIIGRTLLVDRQPVTVAGVIEPGFHFPHLGKAAIWIPLRLTPEEEANRGSHWLYAIAKRKDEVSIQQAQAEMDAVARRLESAYPETNKGNGIRVVALRDQIVDYERPALLAMFGGVVLVLLIACANVANLLLVRANARRKEIGIRLALGAGRGRMIRQLLTESLLLFAFGGALGVLAAFWGVELVSAMIPEQIRGYIPYQGVVRVNALALWFSLSLTLITGIVFGLAPALQVSRQDPQESVREGVDRSSLSARGRKMQSALVVGEISLALLLLVGAGLLMKALLRLQHVDPGFRPENVLAADIILPQGRDGRAFFQELLAKVRAMPSVKSAAVMSHLPYSGSNSSQSFRIEGRPEPPPNRMPDARTRTVSAGYFQTMGIALLAGRAFQEQDHEKAPPVVVISDALARRDFPGEDPVGKRIALGRRGEWRQVVGVVRDVRHDAMEEQARPQVYLPLAQTSPRSMSLLIRTEAGPEQAAGAVRHQVREIDKDQPVARVQTLEQVMSTALTLQRNTARIVGFFAAVALLLAALGVYGVISYSVSQRTREFGIRMALGADRGDVLTLVVRQAILLVGAGAAIGLAGSLAMAGLISHILYGVSAGDPRILAGTLLLLAGAALAASYLPARRATSVDPTVALRYE